MYLLFFDSERRSSAAAISWRVQRDVYARHIEDPAAGGRVNLWDTIPPVCLSCNYERLSFIILLLHNTGKSAPIDVCKKRIRMNPVNGLNRLAKVLAEKQVLRSCYRWGRLRKGVTSPISSWLLISLSSPPRF